MSEKQNAEIVKCQEPGCDKAAGPDHDCFCPSHWFTFKARALHGVAALEEHLRLEGEFVEWCRLHGQPNPHDD